MSNKVRRIAVLIAAFAAPAVFAGGLTGLSAGKKYYLSGEMIQFLAQGSGICEKVQLDWGDGSPSIALPTMQLPMNLTHSYHKTGQFTVSLGGPAAKGTLSSDGCGAAKTTVTIVPGGKITDLKASPELAMLGNDVNVTAIGQGACFEGRRIVSRYRANASAPWGEPVTLRSFGPGDPWPRTTSFKAEKEGQYLVAWMAADYTSAPEGDCILTKPSPAVTVVKTLNLPQLGNSLNTGPANPPSNSSPSNPPKNSPTKTDCKPAGKQGAGKDNCPN